MGKQKMHEMSIAEGILQIVEAAAAKPDGGFKCVKTVFIELGTDACVEPEALLFCFDEMTRGSVAEGAHLEITRTAGTAMRVKELEVVDENNKERV
jgi:hydrogenase nickel incorporation protein HypA/HybF